MHANMICKTETCTTIHLSPWAFESHLTPPVNGQASSYGSFEGSCSCCVSELDHCLHRCASKSVSPNHA